MDYWHISLDEVPSLSREILSNEEWTTIQKLQFEKDQRLVISSLIARRIILAKYVQQAPENLIFSSTSRGKPYLPATPNLTFNVSHSHRTLLLGIAS